jgi:PAS domain S-box-containing protein
MRTFFKDSKAHFQDLIFIIDAEGIITEHTQVKSNGIISKPESDLLGRAYNRVVPEALNEALEHLFDAGLPDTEPVAFCFKQKIKKHVHWYEVNLTKLVKRPNGAPGPFYLCSLKDITQPKLKALLLEKVLDSTTIGITTFNAVRNSKGQLVDFVCTQVNRAAEEILGWKGETVVGQKYPQDFTMLGNEPLFHKLTEVVESGEFLNLEQERITAHGSKVYLHIRATKLDDGFVLTFQDITQQKEEENKVRESEQRYRLLADHMIDMVFIHSLDGTIEYASPSTERIVGFSPAELVGTSPYDYIHPDDVEIVMESHRRALEGYDNFDMEFRSRSNIGHYLWLSSTISCIRNSAKEVVKVQTVCRDVTNRVLYRQRLLQREKQLALLVEQAPTAIAMLDDELKYLSASQRWMEYFNIIGNHIKGKSHERMLPEAGKKWMAIYRNCLAGENYRIDEDCLVHPDGAVQWLRWEARPWYRSRNEIGGLILHAEDITIQKQREEQIQALNKKLYEHNELKDKLFSIMAHDLKSPFTAGLGLLDLICKKEDVLSVKELMTYLKLLRTNLGQTNKTLFQLLEWAKIQKNGQVFNPVMLNLHTETKATLGMLNVTAEAKGIQLENKIAADTSIYADREMIDTILRNLVSNGIKFTPRGGKVSITAHQQGDWLEVQVKDTGVGMKEKDLKALVEGEIHYSTKGTEGEKGTGLGISLCKEFVEKHGGKLWAESAKEKGTTFFFTLPVLALKIEQSNNE